MSNMLGRKVKLAWNTTNQIVSWREEAAEGAVFHTATICGVEDTYGPSSPPPPPTSEEHQQVRG
jgi:hypothetical protein